MIKLIKFWKHKKLESWATELKMLSDENVENIENVGKLIVEWKYGALKIKEK
jgi:hypothetical protein